LGDFVDSSAVYVGPPSAPYRDSDDPGYSTFGSTFAARPVRLYAGANDGMLHAFDEATGNETWAYIPSVLFREAPLAASEDHSVRLRIRRALPPFKHHFYVDETPAIADVNFAAQTNGQDPYVARRRPGQGWSGLLCTQ
jgi:type IV pilus assembly protein PilY1